MVNELTVSCLGLVDVLLCQQTRVHASGAAVHLAMLELSHDGKVLHSAMDEAMRGDGVQASRSLSLCKFDSAAQSGCCGNRQSKELPQLGRFGLRSAREMP